MWAWPGSRDDDNSTVQTAAMGQIPRSTERILVIIIIITATLSFLSNLGHRINSVSGNVRETSFLFQRIAVFAPFNQIG